MTQLLDPSIAPNCCGARPSHLRLVHDAAVDAPTSPAMLELQSTAAYCLCGTLREAPVEIRPSAWHTLLESVWPHEAIELVHRFRLRTSDPASYAFEVRLLQSLAARAGESRDVLPQALAGILPKWKFQAAIPGDGREQVLPLRATFVPAPLRVTRVRQHRTEIEEADWLPFPGELPKWFLTAPFDEQLVDGAWSLEIRFARFVPSDAERARWHRLLQELRRGALRLQEPHVDAQQYLHDVELDVRTQALLAAWLGHSGGGYTVAVRVCAESLVTRYALQRLARDIFGRFPVLTVVAEEPASPAWPLLPQQGLGGFFAADKCLISAGVPIVEREPTVLPPEPGALVGYTEGGRAICLPEALRTSHTLVVGASGSGKSTLLLRMIREEIAAGSGIALIDAHGELFDDVLSAIPPARGQDVVIVDVADPDWSVALNPLQGTERNPRLRNFVCGQICDLIDRLFEGDDTTGPMTRNNLRASLMAAMSHPEGPTLADAPRIFLDDSFRDYLLPKCDERTAQHFRNFRRTTGENGYENWCPYMTARFEPFISSTPMLNLLCRPSTVNLGALMRRRAIILFRLSKSVLSETECQTLGTLLLMQFHSAAIAGTAAGPRMERPFHVVADEFHSYCSPTVPQLFREGRKFGIAYTVATQTVGSLRHPRAGDLANAVMANTASKLFFRMSPREALLVDEYTSPEFPARDLARLPNYRAVLAVPAANVPPLCFKTALPDVPHEVCDVHDLRASSGRKHGTPMASALEFLVKRHGLDMAQFRGW